MTDQQPEALRLADELHDWGVTYAGNFGMQRMLTGAAAELRRLHSVNAQLLEALTKITEQGWLNKGRWHSFCHPEGCESPGIARAAIDAAKGEA